MLITYRYRVKSLNGLLNQQAKAVNFVWNFCNDSQKHALKWNRKWPSGFDLNNLTSGSSKLLDIHSTTVQATCEQYARSRSQFNRPSLRYRGKRTLGWIPMKGGALKREKTGFRFSGHHFKVFYSRPLPEGKIKDGTNFAQDTLGRWYLNIVIEIPDGVPRPVKTAVGIDLGLNTFATLSTGEKIPAPKYYRTLEEDLAIAQRAGKRRRQKKISTKIAHSRKDFLHKHSTRIVRAHDYIAVGDGNSKQLARTRLAKSVNDAAWSSFRHMLRYKAIAHGVWFEEVNERFTSQVCSRCGDLPPERPRGIADLGIRHWTCSRCGTLHDRDVNAAINILARSGHRTPVEGIPLL